MVLVGFRMHSVLVVVLVFVVVRFGKIPVVLFVVVVVLLVDVVVDAVHPDVFIEVLGFVLVGLH